MQDFKVSVTKLTDEGLMRRACEMTVNGTSRQTLASMYRSEHSPSRTQIFWIELKDIPLFVSTHLIRHHVGSQPFQLTCRDDRDGGNPGLIGKIDNIQKTLNTLSTDAFLMSPMTISETLGEVVKDLEWLKGNSDRHTPVNLGLLVNAQSLIDMAKLRLCNKASAETREVFEAIRSKVAEVDADLADMMVPKCVYCGGICHEPKSCGYNKTSAFAEELHQYVIKLDSGRP